MASAASRFRAFAKWTSKATGRPISFVLAVLVVVIWAASGPIFHWSDTWQLVINTGTTVVTFLMVFLIQNTQNRDAEAVQVKLDELIRVTQGAHNSLLDLEELEQEDLDSIQQNYQRLAGEARRRGTDDTDRPEVRSSPTIRRRS